MFLNRFYLFYLTAYRDYKKYWLKTILSLIGLILSISLITTISIYTDTIDYHLNKKTFIESIYPQSYTTKLKGSFSSDDIKILLAHPAISHGYPFKIFSREITIENKRLFSKIIGIDFFNLPSGDFAKNNKDIKPNSILLITNNKHLSEQKSLSIIINKQTLNAIPIYTAEQVTPVIIMDISTLQSQFNDTLIDRFYIETYQALAFKEKPLSNFKVFLSSPKTEPLSKAFFINLQFIGLFSTIISTLLIYLFFRFIQKHRSLTDHLLFQIGIDAQTKRFMRLIESLFFILITTSLGFGLGVLMSHFGLNALNKTMNTLYYSMAITNIKVNPMSFLISLSISSFAVYLATTSLIQIIEKKLLHMNLLKKWLICLTSLSLSVFLIFIGQETDWLAYSTITGLMIISFFMSLIIISGLSYFFSKQNSPKMIMLKTASFYIRKDIILSTMMVMAIGLACGLFMSMSLFISSFQASVSNWIITSTQSDIYIQSKHNTIPRPVPLKSDDIQRILKHPATKNWRSISRENIKIDDHSFILRGIPYHNLKKEIQVIAPPHLNLFNENDILLSESAAKKLNLDIGDTLTIPTPKKNFTGTVAAIYIDYTSEKGIITISRKKMKSLYQDKFLIHGVSLLTNKDYVPDLISSFDHLLIQTKEELQSYVITMFKQTFGLTWVLASISGLIALFVLINMLSVMTIDRRDEINQLFSMGSQKKHLKNLVFSHALWIGGVSLLMSLFIGYSLSLIILKQLTPHYFGWSIPMIIAFKPMIYLLITMICIMIITAYIAYRYIWKNVISSEQVYESIKTYYFTR